jgi:hypothetical protein
MLLSRFGLRASLVIPRQTFVSRCQNSYDGLQSRDERNWLAFEVVALVALNGCNNCRSRASRPDTNRSWE